MTEAKISSNIDEGLGILWFILATQTHGPAQGIAIFFGVCAMIMSFVEALKDQS